MGLVGLVGLVGQIRLFRVTANFPVTVDRLSATGMVKMKTLVDHDSTGDSQLVELCLSGNRNAFAQIVARYQSIICAIAYSACGYGWRW